jgi:hypothetical protein
MQIFDTHEERLKCIARSLSVLWPRGEQELDCVSD